MSFNEQDQNDAIDSFFSQSSQKSTCVALALPLCLGLKQGHLETCDDNDLM